MYSIFMSILWSNIFILILLVCRRSTKLVLSVGVFPLLLLISGSALRCFFPLDFPIFTRVISNDDLLARINTFLKSSIPTTRLTIMHLLGILWITVFMFLTMKFFIRFRRLIQRTKVVLNYKCNPFAYKAVFGTVLCLMMFLFVLSYGFIIQPSYDAPNSEIANGNYVESTPDNTYIYKESDGTFWIHFGGELMEQIDPDSVEMMVDSGFIVKEKFGGSKNE